MIKLGDKVRVLPNAFGDSTDPGDVAARGAVGEVVNDLAAELGPNWAGYWIVEIDGRDMNLMIDEVEVIEEASDEQRSATGR